MRSYERLRKKVPPDGTAAGDILSWDGDSWEPVDILTLISGIEDGTAAGQMLFWDAVNSEWVHTEVTELYWDDTNKRFGIKNSAPTSELDVTGTGTMSRLLAGGVHE